MSTFVNKRGETVQGKGGYTLDLFDVKTVLSKVNTLVDSLDGKNLPEYDYAAKRAEVAAIHRELLTLSDALALAESLTRNHYWMSKGSKDLLAE